MSLGIQLIDDPSSLLPTAATLRFRPCFVEAVGAHTHGIDMLQVRLQVGDMQLNDDSCRQYRCLRSAAKRTSTIKCSSNDGSGGLTDECLSSLCEA